MYQNFKNYLSNHNWPEVLADLEEDKNPEDIKQFCFDILETEKIPSEVFEDMLKYFEDHPANK